MQATIVFDKNFQAYNSDKRYIVNVGSSRSSKTYSIIQLFYIISINRPNTKLSVFRDTKKICKDTVLEDMKIIYPTMPGFSTVEFNITESIFKFQNGSTIHIEGTDDPIKMHGYSCDVLWFNESYNIGRPTFDQLDMRCTGKVFLDLNPRQSHWSEGLEKDSRTVVIHSTFRDNPFCPLEQRLKILSYQSVKFSAIVLTGKLTESEAKVYDIVNNHLEFTIKELSELSRCRENEDKKSSDDFNYMVYALGIKSEKPNRIFHFEEVSDEVYRAIDAPVYYGNDWGVVDPWGVVEVKYRDGELYLHEKHYLSENETRALLTMTELAQINAAEEGIVTWLFGKLGIDKRTPVICDNQRPLKIAALRRAGWQALPANKKPGSIIDGIDIVNNLRVYYTASSTNIKYEQENYSRKVDRYGNVLEEPEDMDNHIAGDPVRYVAMYLQAIGVIKAI